MVNDENSRHGDNQNSMHLSVACDRSFVNDSESKPINFYSKKSSLGDDSATTSSDVVDFFKDGNCISDQSSSPAASKFSFKKFIAKPLFNFSTSSVAHKFKMAKISNGTNNKTGKLINSNNDGLRSKLYHSFPNLHNTNQTVFRRETSAFNLHKFGRQPIIDKCCDLEDENVKKVLQAVANDHVVRTSSADNKIRRTVFVERKPNERFGFTLQSYAFRSRKTNLMERITYIDHVVLDTPAYAAGLRAGDVILATNGRNIQKFAHKTLVQYINDHLTLRMVVLYENCVNRIDLCAKAIKLKKLLSDKLFEYSLLSVQEERLTSGLPRLTEDEIFRYFNTAPSTPSSENSLILDPTKLWRENSNLTRLNSPPSSTTTTTLPRRRTSIVVTRKFSIGKISSPNLSSYPNERQLIRRQRRFSANSSESSSFNSIEQCSSDIKKSGECSQILEIELSNVSSSNRNCEEESPSRSLESIITRF